MNHDAQAMLDQLVRGVNAVIELYVESSRDNPGYREQKRPIVLDKLRQAMRSMSAIDSQTQDEALSQRVAAQRQRLQRVIDMLESRGRGVDGVASPSANAPTNGKIDNGGNSPHRRHKIIGAFIAIVVVCAVICVGICLYYIFSSNTIRDIERSSDLDALESYIVANAGSDNAQTALNRYLDVADSLIKTPDYNLGDDNLLMRADGLAKLLEPYPQQSAMLNEWVKANVDRMYELCVGVDDLDSWRNYMYGVPEAYIYDSGQRVDSLECIAWSAEPTAWDEASATSTRDSYRRYLDTYPNGQHSGLAQGALIDMEVRAYRNRSNGIIEKIDSVGHHDGQQSLIAIFNDTDYPMEWLFSGPTSRRMLVPANNNAQLELGNGAYRILVLVDDSRMDRFSFNQTFTSGVYSSSIGME